MKKIFSLTLLIALIISMCLPTFAYTDLSCNTDTNSEYVKLHGGSIEDQQKNEENRRKAQLELENLVFPLSTDSRTLSIPTYQQEKSYWCGPANIKQVIQYINGSSESQSTYASSMGTNSSDGTLVYKMANELNNRQSVHTYSYTKISSNSKQTLATNIVMNTDLGRPCIFHSRTQYLYMYNGNSLGHYLTCRGYNFSGFETASIGDNKYSTVSNIVSPNASSLDGTVYYTDCYYKDFGRGSVLGNHSDSLDNILSSMNGRYLIY